MLALPFASLAVVLLWLTLFGFSGSCGLGVVLFIMLTVKAKNVKLLYSISFVFLVLLKAVPIYTSTARLYVEQSGPKIINEYEGVMTRSKNYLYTQGELIKSTPIISHVVDDSQIRRLKTFAGVDNLVSYVSFMHSRVQDVFHRICIRGILGAAEAFHF